MSGNATNSGDELPKLHDDEDGGESTVAMEAPAIPNGAPLPVSQPPPAAAPPVAPKVEGFPAPIARPAIPLPSAKGSAVMPGPRPPPTRMPTPAAPLAPRGPMPPNRMGGPLPPAGRLGAAQPAPTPPAPVRPPEASVTDTGILNNTSPTADASAIEDDNDDDDSRDDGPTITTDPGAMIGVGDPNLFGLDDAAARAAQNASRPEPRRPALASAGFAQGGKPEPAKTKEQPKEEDEAATVAVPKDVIERVRANPKAILAEDAARAKQKNDEIPKLNDEEEESTRAVPRDELLRQQDAHVVVGSDAMGDEATVAVAPEANSANIALGGNRMPSPTGGPDEVPAFPPPPLGFPGPGPAPGMVGAYPMGHRPMNAPAPGGPQGQQPGSAPWQQAQPPPSNPMPMGPMGGGAVSSGVMPTALPAGGQYPGQPQQQQHRMGVMPAQQPVQHQQQMGWMQQPQQPAQPAQRGKSSRISGQVILLVIVGAICLAIFVTGIVLFATTKF